MPLPRKFAGDIQGVLKDQNGAVDARADVEVINFTGETS